MYLNLKSLILSVKISVMKFICFLSFVSLSVIGLSGCGGGGSGEDTLPTANIDSSNATEIVRVAASAIFNLTESGELSYLGGQDLFDAASRTALNRSSLIAVRYVIDPQTSLCSVSGSMTISGDIEGTDTLTTGDVIQVNADMCDNGDNEIVDGQMQMTITDLEGDITTSEFLLGVNIVFTEFSVTDSGEEVVFNGDIGITIDMRTPSVTQMTVSGNSFTVSALGETQSISNFSNGYTVNVSETPITWIYDSKGTVISNEFVGTINYKMPVKFEGSGENYPDTGELLITGADNTTLYLRTIDNVDIEIDADYDGDGGVDATFYMTWADLEE